MAYNDRLTTAVLQAFHDKYSSVHSVNNIKNIGPYIHHTANLASIHGWRCGFVTGSAVTLLAVGLAWVSYH